MLASTNSGAMRPQSAADMVNVNVIKVTQLSYQRGSDILQRVLH